MSSIIESFFGKRSREVHTETLISLEEHIKKENSKLKAELKSLNTDFLKQGEMREVMISVAEIPYSEKFFETLIHQLTLQKVDLPSKQREALDQKQGQINQLKLMLREIQSIKHQGPGEKD